MNPDDRNLPPDRAAQGAFTWRRMTRGQVIALAIIFLALVVLAFALW